MSETDRSHPDDHEPAYIISVAARMLGLHAQTLRYYERVGLIVPSRSRGRIRLYSRADLERVRQVQRLIDELGVNLGRGGGDHRHEPPASRPGGRERSAYGRELQKYRDHPPRRPRPQA